MSDRQKSPQLIPPHGGYQDLRSYQMAEVVYDATLVFCDRFIDRRSCTHDQMVQATRSGKHNHAYSVTLGCMASGTSKKTEPKLVGVARASLEELLLDQQLCTLEKDFLEEGGFTERLYRSGIQKRKERGK